MGVRGKKRLGIFGAETALDARQVSKFSKAGGNLLKYNFTNDFFFFLHNLLFKF